MKRSHFLFLVIVVLLGCNDPEIKNIPIDYGSNRGEYISIQNTKIYYEEYGKGMPLLLLHPGLGSIENFKELIPKLADDFRVIIPDAPGHGRSAHADTITRDLLTSFSSELIDRLKLDSVYVLDGVPGEILR